MTLLRAVSTDPKLNNSASSGSDSGLQTTITAASVEDGTLYIRNEISGIYQNGTCNLTLSKGGAVVTRSAGIQPLPKSSTCKGFNIPTSQLSKGTWSIQLNVTINGKSASASGSVEV